MKLSCDADLNKPYVSYSSTQTRAVEVLHKYIFMFLLEVDKQAVVEEKQDLVITHLLQVEHGGSSYLC